MTKQLGALPVTPAASAPGDTGYAGASGDDPALETHRHPREAADEATDGGSVDVTGVIEIDFVMGAPGNPVAVGVVGDIVAETSGATAAAGATGRYADAAHLHGMPTIPGDHTHAATGTGATGGGASLAPVTFRIPQSVPGTTEGNLGYDTTEHAVEYYDTQRSRELPDAGWCPWAFPLGFEQSGVYTTSVALAISGGAVAIPTLVQGHMLLQSISYYNGTGTGTTEGRLYRQYLNNGNSGENTLAEIAGANFASRSNTATAVQTVNISTPGTYLPPGLYWLVLRNTSASVVFALGSLAAGTMALSACQTKTLGSGLGSTLDFVAATWTKVNSVVGARLNGRVFGQTAAF
jgi:hypothetical protein